MINQLISRSFYSENNWQLQPYFHVFFTVCILPQFIFPPTLPPSAETSDKQKRPDQLTRVFGN